MLKKGRENPWTAKKSKPGPKKKTKAEFLEDKKTENFDQRRKGIVRTHTCTLTSLISLGFPYLSRTVKTSL